MNAPVCDYCAEGLPIVDGWHVRVDPEGIEGDQRMPCPRLVWVRELVQGWLKDPAFVAVMEALGDD